MKNLDDLFFSVTNDWFGELLPWFDTPQALALDAFLQQRTTQNATIFPIDPFFALKCTALGDTQIVILGQDPYHGPGQAHGLAFSVQPGVKIPPSLVNIFKEIKSTFSNCSFTSGCLTPWAKQGVLLLNTCLTVEQGQPFSHANKGWEQFTDLIVKKVAQKSTKTIFLLWGAHAQTKESLIKQFSPVEHLILKSNHPSPLAAAKGKTPFIGNQHFKKIQEAGVCIDWST